MKKNIFLVVLMLSGIAANTQTISFTSKTGDAQMDVHMTDINKQAQLDLPGFKTNLSVQFGLPEVKINAMLGAMSPADAFMNAQVASIAKKPVDDVIAVYEKNKGKGWGVIAKEMGIKPGSKEFHELKNATAKKNNELKSKGNSGGKDKDEKENKGGKSKGHGKGKNN